MITLSANTLKKYLKEYELHIKYWHLDDGDGNEMLGCRELLDVNYGLLSEDDKKLLTEIDKKAEALLAPYKSSDSFDIVMLKKTVALAKKHIKQAA